MRVTKPSSSRKRGSNHSLDSRFRGNDSAVSKRVLCVVAAALGLAAILPGAPARAADKEEVTVVKTRGGLNFKLPPDWPVEKRDGVMGPIPIEEYLAMKFSGIDQRLQGLEKQITAMDLRLRVAEEEMKQQKRLQSNGEAGEASP